VISTSSGDLRRRRASQSIHRRLLHHLTTGNRLPRLHSPHRFEPDLGAEMVRAATATSSLRLFVDLMLGKRSPGRPAGAAWRRSGAAVPLCCRAAVSLAPLFFSVSGKPPLLSCNHLYPARGPSSWYDCILLLVQDLLVLT
jgi:hypothetical protein